MICLFTYKGPLGCIQFLAIMNKAAINISVYVFMWTYIFELVGCDC